MLILIGEKDEIIHARKSYAVCKEIQNMPTSSTKVYRVGLYSLLRMTTACHYINAYSQLCCVVFDVKTRVELVKGANHFSIVLECEELVTAWCAEVSAGS